MSNTLVGKDGKKYEVKFEEAKPLTKWEAGNVLVKVADEIGGGVIELKDYPEIQAEVRELRKRISKIFEAHGFVMEMGFGI